MNRFSDGRRLRRSLTMLILPVLASGGCHLRVDPYNDALARQPAPTTASVEGVRSVRSTPSNHRCAFEQATLAAKDGAVIHGPLLMEDPFVVAGSEDGRYAWTSEEFFYWLYGSGHYLISAALVPVSLIHTPIWQAQESDGRRSGKSVLGFPMDVQPVKIAAGSP